MTISVSDPDPHWIRIRWAAGSGSALRMRIQKGENQPQKRRKIKSGLKMFNVRKIRWKKFRFVSLRKTWFKFYQNPDPHWIRIRIGSGSTFVENAGSGSVSAYNQCGSETLLTICCAVYSSTARITSYSWISSLTTIDRVKITCCYRHTT
jgi:hypothetical protein